MRIHAEGQVMVLNIDRNLSFLNEIESFTNMWNSISIITAAYNRKVDEKWICLSLVFNITEKDLEIGTKILYEIPDKFLIIRQNIKFTFQKIQNILKSISYGSLKLRDFNLDTSNFETIDYIKQRRPGWIREGLSDTEGWPAYILRNYAKNDLLTRAEYSEIEDLLKRHYDEPHNSIEELTSKYLGTEVGFGRRGAIYGIVPFYIKLEKAIFESKGTLAVETVYHKVIQLSKLRLNVVFNDENNNIESQSVSYVEKPKRTGNFGIIKKLIPSKINATEARLYLILKDKIVFEDWVQKEEIKKKIIEESEIRKKLPQTEDELRDKIVIPLLQKMGFHKVGARRFHGPGEGGADILPFYKINEFGIREYYAAQIKATKLRGGAAGGSNGNVADALRQFDSAMTLEWNDVQEGIEFYLDHFILVALHGATIDAEKQLFDHPGRRGNRRLIYLTGSDLIDLIEEYEIKYK